MKEGEWIEAYDLPREEAVEPMRHDPCYLSLLPPGNREAFVAIPTRIDELERAIRKHRREKGWAPTNADRALWSVVE